MLGPSALRQHGARKSKSRESFRECETKESQASPRVAMCAFCAQTGYKTSRNQTKGIGWMSHVFLPVVGWSCMACSVDLGLSPKPPVGLVHWQLVMTVLSLSLASWEPF